MGEAAFMLVFPGRLIIEFIKRGGTMSNNEQVQPGKRPRIRLDKSRTDRSFDEEESLWQSEMERMFKMVKEQFEVIKPDAELEMLPLLSIGIFGSPGSGKSSLLKTFVKRANNSNAAEVPGEIRGKIYSLPVITPNRLAEDDHFLYNFLAHALNAEREKDKKKGDQYKDSSILSEIQQKFQDLSEYLKVVNEKEQSLDDDPLGVTLERMERHESGLILKEKLRNFITTFADKMNGLDRSLVLMPVDDADMSVPILVSVLDTCWRYLRHPRLVPVFTFTGRLAEEMLRVHFESKVAFKNIKSSPEKLMQSSISLMMTETLALQYVGKLFPVRNRIRLGPAAARVLAADYIKPVAADTDENKGKAVEPGSDGNPGPDSKTQDVLQLLQNASIFFFGHPDPGNTRDVQVKAPFRVVTLRRQLQIVDAMAAAGIMDFIEEVAKYDEPENQDDKTEDQTKGNKNNDEKNKNKEVDEHTKHTWGMVFNNAVWALMNNHRDILREIKMYLDDLYTWTPHGLRQVILGSILSLDLKKRRQFLMHWRCGTEDRRSQMLSLLAANVFRPWMNGEEATGDDINTILKYEKESKENKYPKKEAYSFPVWKGTTWFIELFIGFYLPQILAVNKKESPDPSKDSILKSVLEKKDHDRPGAVIYIRESRGSSPKEPVVYPITCVGWDLASGPVRAIREALYNKDRFYVGMLIMDYDPVKKIFEIKKENYETIFNLWCYYGYDGGKPFVALSLWRGLGLIGQLLKLNFYKTEQDEQEKNEKIREILENHLKDARVIVNPPKRNIHENTSQSNFNVRIWDDNIIRDKMEDDIKNWLKKFKSEEKRISPILRKEKKNDSKVTKGDIKNLKEDWRKCFIRRLHGNNLLSNFWKNLEDVAFKDLYFKTLKKSNSNEKKIYDPERVLREWVYVLLEYWNEQSSKEVSKTYPVKDSQDSFDKPFVREALIRCPIIKKSVSGLIDENK